MSSHRKRSPTAQQQPVMTDSPNRCLKMTGNPPQRGILALIRERLVRKGLLTVKPEQADEAESGSMDQVDGRHTEPSTESGEITSERQFPRMPENTAPTGMNMIRERLVRKGLLTVKPKQAEEVKRSHPEPSTESGEISSERPYDSEKGYKITPGIEKNTGEHRFEELTITEKLLPQPRSAVPYRSVPREPEETLGSDRPQGPVIGPGKRRIMNTIFRGALAEYAIPKKLREICCNDTTLNLSAILIDLECEIPVLAEGLLVQNYGAYLHTLLFVEEVAKEKRYERLATQAPLYQTKECVTFKFPADSWYSKVGNGDFVLASKPGEKKKCEAKVCSVSSTQLSLDFNKNFRCLSDVRYNLEFKMNRTLERRHHQAVDLVLQNLGAEWLFPNKHGSASCNDGTEIPSRYHANLNYRKYSAKNDAVTRINWCNKNLNYEQKSAVKNILAKKNLPYPYVIYGPPGTGKTVTVVETILQIVFNQASYRILVTAPTNCAVDILGTRLLESGIFNKSEMVRLSSYNAYNNGSIAEQLINISMVPGFGDSADGTPLAREIAPSIHLDDIREGKYKIVLGTLSTISWLNAAGVSKGYFTHIIIDEAGQCHEPHTFLAVAFVEYNKTQLVLAGDPLQLGPTITSVVAKQYSFHQSFLDRLTYAGLYGKTVGSFNYTHGYNPVLITRLVSNYRSHRKIVDVVGNIFYGGDLWPTISDESSREARALEYLAAHWEVLSDCMLFINVNTPEEQADGSHSWFNQGEIAQLFFVLNFFYRMKVSSDEIGVITPYALQVRKILEHLDTQGAVSPKVGSVEEFQGHERDIVILSMVRNNLGTSRRLSGFITDRHRVNVALSRARVINIIIGNLRTLQDSPLWAQIISCCCVINPASNSSTEDTVD